jgi:hypothetical protein
VSGNGQNGEDGPLQMAVTRHEDKVVIHFSQSREYVAMSAEQASQMGEQLARAAYEAHYGREAPTRGAELARQIKAKTVDEMRPRIIRRVEHTIRSLVDQHWTPQAIAERAVDAVLKEVT